MGSGGPSEGLYVPLFRATPISGRGHVKGFGTEIAGVKFEASYRVRYLKRVQGIHLRVHVVGSGFRFRAQGVGLSA